MADSGASVTMAICSPCLVLRLTGALTLTFTHSSRERPIFDLRAFAEPFGERERVRDPGNWSAYDFVHSKKRNRLGPDRARDLVYVFTNMRLQKKVQKSEAFAEWNKGTEETQEEREEALA